MRPAANDAASLPRTYLFVPGNRPDRFGKALASGADAVILDLEDAVAPQDKAAAREAIAAWCEAGQRDLDCIVVRINDEATEWFADDLNMIHAAGLRAVMLPKVELASQVARVASALPKSGFVIPIIESARGLLNVDAIAAAEDVQRLAFGTLDYAADLDLSGDSRGLLYPACRMALASRAAGLASPVAGVTADLGNEDILVADLALARACGFGAKLCIHPNQVGAIHRALAPTAAELDWARRVVAAAETETGAFQIDGKMVDRPVILKARAILGRARDDAPAY
ncbi:HpcH/HpaI aldolase/citrate lyase family protein [Noviherbaspirillum denitrificans]|uniref:Host specificity protein n=1 Tax=Noviherbaspirillum denitrificans TaxID=1968433 RepID=A0A254TBW9_9BURK|nr:CoA ester lyase [Noviherbaspirillum denitrificans]OWW20045.1 host specificity protein [Noviherbaspirillum denitrificans]